VSICITGALAQKYVNGVKELEILSSTTGMRWKKDAGFWPRLFGPVIPSYQYCWNERFDPFPWNSRRRLV